MIGGRQIDAKKEWARELQWVKKGLNDWERPSWMGRREGAAERDLLDDITDTKHSKLKGSGGSD